MQPFSRSTPRVRRFERVLAWLLASLVFALGLLAVSPTAHALLHEHPTDAHDHTHALHDDAGCVVTLFQQGVTTPLDLPNLDTPLLGRVERLLLTSASLVPTNPRHLLQPARGPPAGRDVSDA